MNTQNKQTVGHTPGEWKWKQTRGNNEYEHSVYVDMFENRICHLGTEDNGEVPPEEIKANARLIVSAVNNTAGKGINPEAVYDLLEACKKALEIRKITHHGDDGLISILEKAINKATKK